MKTLNPFQSDQPPADLITFPWKGKELFFEWQPVVGQYIILKRKVLLNL